MWHHTKLHQVLSEAWPFPGTWALKLQAGTRYQLVAIFDEKQFEAIHFEVKCPLYHATKAAGGTDDLEVIVPTSGACRAAPVLAYATGVVEPLAVVAARRAFDKLEFSYLTNVALYLGLDAQPDLVTCIAALLKKLLPGADQQVILKTLDLRVSNLEEDPDFSEELNDEAIIEAFDPKVC